jgi:hypothetical protein
MAVTRVMPQMSQDDEIQLRAFYASCGVSAPTIENAIRARRNGSVEVRGEPKSKSTIGSASTGAHEDKIPGGFKLPLA